MAIAVIADTHDSVPQPLLGRLALADSIWHLGDVCQPHTLEPILALGKSLVIVRGNNDLNLEWPLYTKTVLGSHRCLLIHILPNRLPPGRDVILHGHTHVPRDEVVDGVRLLNPGCVSRANKGAPRSFAWLGVGEEGELVWQLELF